MKLTEEVSMENYNNVVQLSILCENSNDAKALYIKIWNALAAGEPLEISKWYGGAFLECDTANGVMDEESGCTSMVKP
jgi:hypothetical protein